MSKESGVNKKVSSSIGARSHFYTAKIESGLFCLYRCAHCGSMNLQYIELAFSSKNMAESEAVHMANSSHTLILKRLFENEHTNIDVFKAADLRTRCLKCGKRPCWATGRRKLGKAEIFIPLALMAGLCILFKYLLDNAKNLSIYVAQLLLVLIIMTIPAWVFLRTIGAKIKLPDTPVLFAKTLKDMRDKLKDRPGFEGVNFDQMEKRYAEESKLTKGSNGIILE